MHEAVWATCPAVEGFNQIAVVLGQRGLSDAFFLAVLTVTYSCFPE